MLSHYKHRQNLKLHTHLLNRGKSILYLFNNNLLCLLTTFYIFFIFYFLLIASLETVFLKQLHVHVLPNILTPGVHQNTELF